MSENDTPRTEAAWNASPVGDMNPLLVLCRQLERELRDLQAQLVQKPCCMEWHTCMKPCVPLAENWRMDAKRLERELAAANARADEAERETLLQCKQIAFDLQSDDPQPGTWNDACDTIYVQISALKSAPAQDDGSCQIMAGGSSNLSTKSVAKRESDSLGPARDAVPDADGHCTICGLPWPDERETLEPHECPPGFKR